jgi:hypothetical protein
MAQPKAPKPPENIGIAPGACERPAHVLKKALKKSRHKHAAPPKRGQDKPIRKRSAPGITKGDLRFARRFDHMFPDDAER